VTQEPHKDSLATRRGVLAGVGLVGLAGAITACGAGGSSSSSAAGDPAASSSSGSGGGTSATTASVPTASAASSSSGALAATSDIPVGGGKIFDTQLVVVTQPSAGEFKAFSAVCTHMGCTVSQIADGRIDCPCHGSEYSIKNGAVLAGPAPKPLPAKQIKISGDSIFLE
jgi:nitrite reductase/ring-hydroxylating ferredoxin subunit